MQNTILNIQEDILTLAMPEQDPHKQIRLYNVMQNIEANKQRIESKQ